MKTSKPLLTLRMLFPAPLQHFAVHTLAVIADAENKVPLFIFADSQPDVTSTGSHRILGYIQDV